MKLCIRIALVILFASTNSADSRAAESPTSHRWDFEDIAAGKLPEGWKVEGTNQNGPLATWEVVDDNEASEVSKTLALTKPNHTSGGTFNLIWTDKIQLKNGEISVRLKANSGGVDQGGGIIWRARDKDNYYICRANPLENNIRLYFIQGGKRTMLKSADIDMPSGQWHRLRITQDGPHIHCFFNDKLLLEIDDTTFTEPGGIGLWTKADAATSFDGLEIHLYEPVETASPQTADK